jgi:hypothetical protein
MNEKIITLVNCPICGKHEVNLTLEEAATRIARKLNEDFNLFGASIILADMFGVDKKITADAILEAQKKISGSMLEE